MPKKITAYQADDGSIHDSECAAATRDVELMVQRSPLAENQPFARLLVEWMTNNADEITDKLAAHGRACPKDARDVRPDPEREGPVARLTEIHPEHATLIRVCNANRDRASEFILGGVYGTLDELLAQGTKSYVSDLYEHMGVAQDGD